LKSLSLIALLSLSLSTFASNMNYSSFCQSPSVKAISAQSGSCQLVITPTPKKTESAVGKCTGTLMGFMECTVLYNAAFFPMVNYRCSGSGITTPISKIEDVDVSSYKVSALVTDEVGSLHFLNDPNNYLALAGRTVKIQIARMEIDGKSQSTTEIAINSLGWKNLTDVKCE
jgi:hypothetical protein